MEGGTTILLSTLGLEKYIANTKEEYVDKVEELANNMDELKDIGEPGISFS
jgi:hypothetical protein